MSNPSSKSEAIALAKALKGKMETRGWRIRVWENLGWHYGIESRWIHVYPASIGYSAYLNSYGDYSTGDSCGYWNGSMMAVESSKDPNEAVARRICSAQMHANELNSKLALVRKSLGIIVS